VESLAAATSMSRWRPYLVETRASRSYRVKFGRFI